MSETTIALISVIGVICVFVLGTVKPFNIGVLGFTFSLLIITVCGLDIAKATVGFPTKTFIMLMGITYMFTTARMNGTIDLLCNAVLRSIKGRRALLPWIFFLAGAVLAAFGNGPGAATMIVAPTAMALAKRAKINQLLMGTVTIFGTFAGSVVTVNWFGALVISSIENVGYQMPGILFRNEIIVALICAVIFYIIFGGLKLFKKDDEALRALESETGTAGKQPVTLEQKATFAAVIVLIICGAVFSLNVGYVAFLLGFLLNLFDYKRETQVIKAMPWPTLVLVGGIITLVTLMNNLGGTDLIVDALTSIVPDSIAPLVLLMLAGLVSYFATSSAVIVAFAPMAIELMTRIGNPNMMGMLAAVVIASTTVDCSPMAMNGAAVVASFQGEEHEKQSFFKKLSLVGLVMIPIGSFFSWLLFVVLGI